MVARAGECVREVDGIRDPTHESPRGEQLKMGNKKCPRDWGGWCPEGDGNLALPSRWGMN